MRPRTDDKRMDTMGFIGPRASKSKKIPIAGFRANGLFFETYFSFFLIATPPPNHFSSPLNEQKMSCK